MLGKSKLNELPLRRQALILESDLNRLALQGELQNLRAATARFGIGGKARSWLLALAPVVGFTVTGLFRRHHRNAPASRLTSLVSCVPPLFALWRSFRNGE